MNFSISEVADIRIIRITENITYINQKDFFEMVEAVVSGDCRRIILDLSSLKFLGSLGIGAITRLYQKVKKTNRDITIISPPKPVLKVFNLTGLAKVIPFADSEAEALRKYNVSDTPKEVIAHVNKSEVAQKIARLADKNSEVRRYVAWSLGLLRDREAIPHLEKLLEEDPSSEVRAAAADALRKLTGRTYTWTEPE
jgi:anti-anti-sigma factor